jgi:replicative DNA helicase
VDDVADAEQALVGCLALAPERVAEVAGWLEPADFRSGPAGLLYRRLLSVAAPGSGDPRELLGALRAAGELRSDGYPLSLLLRWWDATPVPGHVVAYGRLVVEAAAAWQVEAAGQRLLQVSEGGGPVRALTAVRVQRVLLAAVARRLERLPGAAPCPQAVSAVSGWPVGARPVAGEVLHAERVTLGVLLVAPGGAARVRRWLAPSDFAAADVAAGYAAVLELQAAGQPVDRVTVAARLHATGRGGAARVLGDCEASVPAAVMAPAYARTVLSASVLRQVAVAGAELLAGGRARAGGGVATVAAALARLDSLAGLGRRWRVATALTEPRRSAVVPARSGAGRAAAGVDRAD